MSKSTIYALALILTEDLSSSHDLMLATFMLYCWHKYYELIKVVEYYMKTMITPIRPYWITPGAQTLSKFEIFYETVIL